MGNLLLRKKEGYNLLLFLQAVFYIIGVASILYYIWIVCYIGFRCDFSLIWICIFIGCLLMGVTTRHIRIYELEAWRNVIKSVCIVIIPFLMFFFVLEVCIFRTGERKPERNADYVIVLGAHVNGKKISMALKNRLDIAYDYLKQNQETKVIVSGGKGKGEEISEAQAMFVYLVSKGIQKDRIIKETMSESTKQNLEFSSRYVKVGSHIVVITNKFHLFRSMGIARKEYPSCKIDGYGAKTGNALVFQYYVRESIAIVKEKMAGNM